MLRKISNGFYKPRALPHEPSLQEAELELAKWIEKFMVKA
jgi:hypothetical protein